MHTRVFAPLVAVTLVMVFGLWAHVRGQAPSGTATFDLETINTDAAIEAAANAARAAADARANWTPPRTPWGDPDLRGYWLSLTYTPIERPAELADKPLYTEQEALAAFRKAVELDAVHEPGYVHYDWKEFGMDAWQSPVRPNLRTSLIVDPPDGRVPPLTPEGQKRVAALARGPAVPSRGLAERCVTGNQGPPRSGHSHDSESQIIQTPGYVVLFMQSNNDVRIIPLDGRPHLPQQVGQWLGDPRGRWEGDTLVVETTNFHPNRIWRGAAGNLHLVERYTRIDLNTIKYEFTVTDPTTWTRPWTAEVPWPKIEPAIYEWACHEQNYGLMNVVIGAQISAREAAQSAGEASDR